MLWQGLVGISWHTRGIFLLCWFVTITDILHLEMTSGIYLYIPGQ